MKKARQATRLCYLVSMTALSATLPTAAIAQTGINAGTFLIEPAVGLFVESESNVLGETEDPKSDMATVFRPSIRVSNSWRNLDFALYGKLNSRRYDTYVSQDTDDSEAELTGNWTLPQSQSIALGLKSTEYADRQTSAENFAGPRPLTEKSTAGALTYERRSGILGVQAGADIRTLRYDDPLLTTNGIDPRDRDESFVSISAGLGEPSRQLFAGGRFGKIAYESIDQTVVPGGDATVSEGFIGFRYEDAGPYSLTGRVGAFERSYEQPGVETLTGLDHEIQLTWAVSALTSLTLVSTRSFEETRIAGSSGYSETNNQFNLTHRFTETLAFKGIYGWGTSIYENIDIEDETTDYELRLSARLGRHLEAIVSYGGDSRERRKGNILSKDIEKIENEQLRAGAIWRF